MAEITNSITGTIEKIQTTDGVSHPLNATYLNGKELESFATNLENGSTTGSEIGRAHV